MENKILPEEENELYEHYSFIVEKGQQPLRIDKYLMNFVENATRNKKVFLNHIYNCLSKY